MTQGFFSREDIGGLDDWELLESLRQSNKKHTIMSVKAKFTCNSVIPFSTGKTVNFHAVYGSEGENADFSRATPSGSFSMIIDNGTPAVEFFEQGKDYYLIFEKA